MEDNCTLGNCSEHDVFLFGSTTFKVDKLKKEVNEHFQKRKLGQQIIESLSSKHIDVSNIVTRVRRGIVDAFYENWFIDGINCEIFKIGNKGWQKGKIRIKLNISLEFCPDEPEVEKNLAVNLQEISQSESPLDDIRRIINHV